MPGDLSNPEFTPWHYDSKYDPGTGGDNSRPLSIDQILQAVSRSECGGPLTKEQLAEAHAYLRGKNMLNRVPGDQEVQETIQKYFKARKVASKWLTSINSF
jgi:hypothetical protein